MVYFKTKNCNLGTLEGLAMEDVGVFLATWFILLPFTEFYGHLVNVVVDWYIYSPFWYIVPRKIWQP
jgi:hypothetical protein